MAGVIAERLFDEDFHEGSSLDEIVAAQSMSVTVGRKVGKDPKRIYGAVCATVTRTLERNETIVRGIATRLMRVRKLEEPKLDRILAGVIRINTSDSEKALRFGETAGHDT